MGNGMFDGTMNLLGSALDLRAARHELISSNIANQETPGYRSKDINFEEELKKRTGESGSVALAVTNAAHLDPTFGSGMKPLVIDRRTDIEGLDGNSVGIEGEMARMSDNTLMYTTAAKMLKSKLGLLMTAIREGGK